MARGFHLGCRSCEHRFVLPRAGQLARDPIRPLSDDEERLVINALKQGHLSDAIEGYMYYTGQRKRRRAIRCVEQLAQQYKVTYEQDEKTRHSPDARPSSRGCTIISIVWIIVVLLWIIISMS